MANSSPRPHEPNWSAPMPDRSERQIHIMAPIPGAPVKGIILSRRIVSVPLHWHADPAMKGGGRSVPHLEPVDGCTYCMECNQKPRWHGFLGVWLEKHERQVIFDISLNAAQSCARLNPKHECQLRGFVILLRRIGKSRNSPVVAELSEDPLPEHTVPADFDLQASLRRVWGLQNGLTWRLTPEGDPGLKGPLD